MKTTPSPNTIAEAIGRAKAASGIVAAIPAQLDTDRAVGLIAVTSEQRDRLAILCRDLAARSIALCTLLHEIHNTQPTAGETHVANVAAR